MAEQNVTIQQVMACPEKIKFAFQPVFDVRSGTVFGHEALMRPFPYSPMDVIEEFEELGRLNEIEEITTYYAAKRFLELKLEGKLFINSFPAAYVSRDAMLKVKALTQNRLRNRLVVEILEYTKLNIVAWQEKQMQFAKNNVRQMIAIDDFGTGQNIDRQCIEIYSPDIVKVDRKIISGIDSDPEKQRYMDEIILEMNQNHVEVLAEGVETQGEYEYLKNRSVKYMQGYYLGRPNLYEGQ